MDKLAVVQSEETIAELEKIDKSLTGLIGNFEKLVDVTSSVGKNISTPKELVASQKQILQVEKEYQQILKQTEVAKLSLAKVEQQLIKNQIEEARLRSANANAEKSEINLAQKRAQAAEREAKATSQSASLYEKLNKEHIEARKNAKEMALQYGILSREFQQAAAEANRLDQQLKHIDGSLGQFQRNVGNYHGNMWGLSAQMQQVMREMPNFAMDARIGIMSLSNNLPYLADAISEVRQQEKLLKEEFKAAAIEARNNAIQKELAAGADMAAATAAGKHAEALVMQNYQAAKAPSIWKQLASSIFSWQSLLIVGISLLMQYSDEIEEFVKSLFKANDAASIAKKNTEDLNAARKEGAKSAAQEIAQLETLYRVATNEALSREQRLRATDQLQKLYPLHFKNMSDEQIMLGQSISAYLKLRDAIMASSYARAAQKKLDERTEGRLEYNTEWEDKYAKEVLNLKRLKGITQESILVGNQMIKVTDLINQSEQRLSNMRTDRFKKRRSELKEDASLIKYIAKNQNIAAPYEADKYGANPTPAKTSPTNSKGSNNGANLTGAQRDYLNELQAVRDNEIAAQKQAKMDGLITEEQYWQEYIKIVKKYRDAVSDYLTGKNAKEKATEASVRRRAIDEIEKANKEIFDFEFKQNEENHKIKINQFERQQAELESNDYITNTDRLAQQIDLDNKMIEQSRLYWHNQIELAKSAHQDTLELERKRDEEIGKYQAQRNKNAEGGLEAVNKDVADSKNFTDSMASLSFSERRLKIMNSSLSISERQYQLDLLQKEEEQDSLIRRQNDLEYQKIKYSQAAELTIKQRNELAAINAELAEIGVKLKENADASENIKIDHLFSGLIQPVTDILSQNGFVGLADQIQQRWTKLFEDLKNGTLDWKDVTALAVSAVSDVLAQANEKQLQNRIAQLDEELRASEEATNQEIGFIEKRIDWMNSLGDLTKDQIAERSALEDEARVLREQQLQREKLIATQKAKAEQRAAAQQALIQGLLGAAKSIPNWAQVAASVAAGALMAGLIMAKDPTPKYFVGRDGGKAEWAWTQEKGREIITDRHGNIKDFGSDSGARMTWLDKDDKVFTAEQTAKILSGTPDVNYSKLAMDSLKTPMVVVRQPDNSEKIISGVGSEFDRVMRKYDKIHVFENEKGEVFSQTGGQIPVKIGRKKNRNIEIKVRDNGRRD